MTLSGPIRRVTLRTRLLLSVLGVGVLLAALLVVASNIVAGASARSYQALTTQALPLAELHGLQSSINRIRVIEVELPQMREFFAVTAQLEQLEVERAAFAKGLAAFLEDGVAVPGDVAAMLRGQWERYNANLDVVVMHGMQMDMAEVARIAAYESTARFKAISRGLQDIAAQTETAARVEFDRSAQAHQAQMQVFMLVSAFGLMAFAVWLVWLWRALFGRLLSLRDAAIRVADGRAGDALAVAGDDELADLAVAFNVMQERVSAREQALREAQDALELRVQVRTQELRDSNARLVAEMGERLGVTVEAAPDAETLVRESQVVVTTTASKAPLVRADWLHPGLLITAVGSDLAGKQELDAACLERAERVVCDRWAQCSKMGELQHATLTEDRVTEIGAITAGRAPGRRSEDEIIVCDLTA